MGSIPNAIAEAVLAFRKTVKSLVHDANNPHDNYDYVSIDKYYAEVGKAATAIGLVWRTRELSFDLIENMGRSKDRTYVKCVFAYDLMAGGQEAIDYMRVTIISPIAGPQTTGQLYSYADKVFMRVLGCVVTGEKDADAQKQEPIQSEHQAGNVVALPLHDKATGEILTPPPTPMGVEQSAMISREKDGLPLIDTRKIMPGDPIGLIEAIFKTWVPTVKSGAKLRDFYAENLAAIEIVKQHDPAAHERIKSMFTQQKQALSK